MEFDIVEHERAFKQAHSQFIRYISYNIGELTQQNRNAPDIAQLHADYTSLENDMHTLSAYMAMYTRNKNDDTLHMIILNSVAYTVKCIKIQYYIDTLYNVKQTNCAEDVIGMYITSDTAEKRSIGIFMQMSVLLYNDYRDMFDKADENEIDIKSCNDPITNVSESFDSIRGQASAIEQLQEMYILPFKYPNLFMNRPSGVLLYGPPGTGKTLLARASVHEFTRAAFYAPTPGALKGKYIGETEKNIDRVFNCAKHVLSLPDKENPSVMTYRQSIIFFDEFDSVAGIKSQDDPNMALSVNALLQQMDGIHTSSDVTVIASTNFPWRLNDAILRRFNSQILVDLADPSAIRSIILDIIKGTFYTPIINYTGTSDSDDVLVFLKSGNHECDGTLDPTVYGTLTEAMPKPAQGDIYDAIGIHAFLVRYGYIVNEQWLKIRAAAEQINFCIDSDLSVEYVVSLFTPSAAGLEIKHSIAVKKENYDIDANEAVIDGPNIFGYSPSDIKQIIATAIRNAADRAVQGPLILDESYPRPIYVPVSRTYANKLETVYVTEDYKDDPPLSDTVKREIVPDRSMIFNTTLTQKDVLHARDSTVSTIRNRDYVNLLKFSALGTIPIE